MTSITQILEDRKKTHGDFGDHAMHAQGLKTQLYQSLNWSKLSAVEREALEMIQHKIARILTGNPHHPDHWDDIAGYATLVSQRLQTPYT